MQKASNVKCWDDLEDDGDDDDDDYDGCFEL